jgi:hypothetical protein
VRDGYRAMDSDYNEGMELGQAMHTSREVTRFLDTPKDHILFWLCTKSERVMR